MYSEVELKALFEYESVFEHKSVQHLFTATKVHLTIMCFEINGYCHINGATRLVTVILNV